MPQQKPTYILYRKFIGDVSTEGRQKALRSARNQERHGHEPGTLVVWADGSYKPKRRKASAPFDQQCTGGAGSAIFEYYGSGSNSGSYSSDSYASVKMENSTEAEAVAINVGLKGSVERAIASEGTPHAIRKVVIYNDCRSWLENFRKSQLNEPFMATDRTVIQLQRTIWGSHMLADMGVSLRLQWVPGHAGVRGNVLADRLAAIELGLALRAEADAMDPESLGFSDSAEEYEIEGSLSSSKSVGRGWTCTVDEGTEWCEDPIPIDEDSSLYDILVEQSRRRQRRCVQVEAVFAPAQKRRAAMERWRAARDRFRFEQRVRALLAKYDHLRTPVDRDEEEHEDRDEPKDSGIWPSFLDYEDDGMEEPDMGYEDEDEAMDKPEDEGIEEPYMDYEDEDRDEPDTSVIWPSFMDYE
ncbi:uncharacterized protein K452DRAFT_341852 [Aplosporella prunicola CBS 121167]|uniref:RNase H type-1 domain-containing protein n=1 Tax=Aplosporella prunicola CBS 121167 TaxID=1176127 RepID=A0A6A6AZ81_9PEZI|nr:uncharacterized protein K452DRAFT_341852 [Aplosporella prunicola CBS 121167]KAF2136946.1 hypothetical protein K452DRAFT_341852 [Aplosporella prunicola CBS 121167]